MKRLVHRARRLAMGIAAMAMALLYLLALTQIAFPVRQGLASLAKAGTEVRKEAFACALHKCGCKNAQQCRTSCCCFPKSAPSRSHGGDQGHGDDHMAQYKTCNGPDGLGDGLSPPLSTHLPMQSAGNPAPASARKPLTGGSHRLPTPFADPPGKIPISALS